MLHYKLGDAITYPPGYPNIAEYRRVEMFHGILPTEKRSKYLQLFQSYTCLKTPENSSTNLYIQLLLFSFSINHTNDY